MEEGIDSSGNDLFIATSLHIGSVCDVVWPLGWALENKGKSPNSAFFWQLIPFSHSRDPLGPLAIEVQPH